MNRTSTHNPSEVRLAPTVLALVVACGGGKSTPKEVVQPTANCSEATIYDSGGRPVCVTHPFAEYSQCLDRLGITEHRQDLAASESMKGGAKVGTGAVSAGTDAQKEESAARAVTTKYETGDTPQTRAKASLVRSCEDDFRQKRGLPPRPQPTEALVAMCCLGPKADDRCILERPQTEGTTCSCIRVVRDFGVACR